MTATNLPIDTALLATQRQQLKTVLLAHYGEKKKTEVEQLFEENNGTNNHETKNKNSSTGMQSMQEIIPGLYCGSYHPAADKATLEAAGITHILCCIGTSPRFPDSFSYLTIATDDRPDFNIEPFFARTFEFIENALVKEHKKVLVHCGAGISRAPSVVCAYLIRKLRLPAVEAIALIRRKRPFASPNTGFTKQLKSYATSLGIAASKDKVAEALKEKEGREAALKACMEE
ncbi:dual specificity phosphatase 12 [Angomonas deanei]|nr:dual specificity phosphatase 12 [Angomonas deanei]|eukprot:EPY31090.1 dual specificity phosphatase 12 [Angomonas deanei]